MDGWMEGWRDGWMERKNKIMRCIVLLHITRDRDIIKRHYKRKYIIDFKTLYKANRKGYLSKTTTTKKKKKKKKHLLFCL